MEVAEGLAPFDYTSARAPSAMALTDAVHAAVATLEALCFGGKGDTPNDARATRPRRIVSSTTRTTPRHKNRHRAVCVVGDARGDARRRARGRPSSILQKVPRTPPRARSTPSSSPSPGTSPEEKEYAAFLRWLDGGANAAAAETSAGFERKSSGRSDLARDRGSAFGDRASLGDRATNATNATKGGRRKTKTIPSSRVAVAALVVVAALVAAAALLVAVVVSWRVIAERARRRRGDGSIARARTCAPSTRPLALENGDEVRLVARRRAGARTGA